MIVFFRLIVVCVGYPCSAAAAFGHAIISVYVSVFQCTHWSYWLGTLHNKLMIVLVAFVHVKAFTVFIACVWSNKQLAAFVSESPFVRSAYFFDAQSAQTYRLAFFQYCCFVFEINGDVQIVDRSVCFKAVCSIG